jgi:retron-type reverse transcriptase
MAFHSDSELWLEEISRWQVPAATKIRVIEYAKFLERNGLPVIFEFSHLSDELSITPSVLADMVNRTDSFYREFTIPKRRGGKRVISVPSPILLEAQRWIYLNVLVRRSLHDSAYGFVSKRSSVDNARKHLGARCLLKVDLKDFFPSISNKRVISIFRNFGYAPNVSYYLTKLCCQNEALPQGAATSPYLSNIIATTLDLRLSALSDKLNLTYTRYADDISISGDEIRPSLLGTIRSIIESEGFALNNDKTVIVRRSGKKLVTGISVAGENLRLSKSYKREIRKIVYFIEKYGLESHMEKTGEFYPVYLDRVKGKIQYCNGSHGLRLRTGLGGDGLNICHWCQSA